MRIILLLAQKLGVGDPVVKNLVHLLNRQPLAFFRKNPRTRVWRHLRYHSVTITNPLEVTVRKTVKPFVAVPNTSTTTLTQ